MKKSIVAVSVVAMMSIAGCASQSQIEEQNRQLAAINITLKQIQTNQMELISLQKPPLHKWDTAFQIDKSATKPVK